MPTFVNETKTIQAEWWGEKETATIRRFGYGDREALAAVYVRVERGEDGRFRKRFDPQLALERMNPARIERGLVEWTDAEGNQMPVTAEKVAALEGRDAEFILDQINQLNPERGRTAKEQASFRGGGGDGDQERGTGASGADEPDHLRNDEMELEGTDGDSGGNGG